MLPDMACSFLRSIMKLLKILKKKKETATALPKTEKAMLPKLEKRNK